MGPLGIALWILFVIFLVIEAAKMLHGDVMGAIAAATLAAICVVGIGVSRWLR